MAAHGRTSSDATEAVRVFKVSRFGGAAPGGVRGLRVRTGRGGGAPFARPLPDQGEAVGLGRRS